MGLLIETINPCSLFYSKASHVLCDVTLSLVPERLLFLLTAHHFSREVIEKPTTPQVQIKDSSSWSDNEESVKIWWAGEMDWKGEQERDFRVKNMTVFPDCMWDCCIRWGVTSFFFFLSEAIVEKRITPIKNDTVLMNIFLCIVITYLLAAFLL